MVALPFRGICWGFSIDSLASSCMFKARSICYLFKTPTGPQLTSNNLVFWIVTYFIIFGMFCPIPPNVRLAPVKIFLPHHGVFSSCGPEHQAVCRKASFISYRPYKVMRTEVEPRLWSWSPLKAGCSDFQCKL